MVHISSSRLRLACVTLPLLAGLAGCGSAGAATEVVAACGATEVAASPPDAEFTRIAGLAVDSSGTIYVADAGGPRVVVLSPAAEPLRRLGRAGEGPGEFGDLSSVQVFGGDSVLALDRRLNRLTVFAAGASAPARIVNLSQTTEFAPPFAVAKTEAGPLLAEYRQYYRGDDDPAADAARRRVFRLLGEEGQLLRDSVLVLPEPETDLVLRRDGIVMTSPNPFGRRGPWALGPRDRLLYGWGDSLSIQAFSLEGRQVGGFTRPHVAAPLTAQEVDVLVEERSEALQQTVRAAAPRSWPAFQQFVVDDRGRTWVGLLAGQGRPTAWLAHDPDGRPVCSAELPESVHVQQVRGDRLYAVALDEMDVPRVVVYQITIPSTDNRSSPP